MRTKLSSKGQVIIPKEVRDSARLVPGTEFDVAMAGEVIELRPVTKRKRYTVDDLIGCVKYDGPPKTLADMEAGIEAGLRERWSRKRKMPRR